MNSNVSGAPDLQQKYRHFRILVIGRANAGKTTLLKRVCNTTEEPCIYNEERNLRGAHDIHQSFAFASNPQFIFHDSPGFEKGGEKELKDVQEFIEKCAQATNVEDQLHAIWYCSSELSFIMIIVNDCWFRFCLVTDASRPLLELETRFFQKKRFGNVPVIAVFTKLDDLITQLYDEEKEESELHEDARLYVEQKFQEPLAKCKYPPKEYLCLEDMYKDEGNHQEQVKELMQKTADSLDNPTLQLLFVSIQQNNLELCIKYAVKYINLNTFTLQHDAIFCLQWFCHVYVQQLEDSFEKSWELLTEDHHKKTNLESGLERLLSDAGKCNKIRKNNLTEIILNSCLYHTARQ
ncbi:hypothetical protein WG66_001719 [Moniliophthora roreri]|nr:hypothetical protein WG66_001719 [Moniliophthora roreri]